MRFLAIALLTFCATVGAACGAQTDLAKAREELREAIEAAVKKHPEIGDRKAFVAGRVKGKNGWEDLKKLALDWKATTEGEAAPAWVSVFMGAEQLRAEPYSEEEKNHLRVGFDATAAMSSSAAKLLTYDCLVELPDDTNEDEGVAAGIWSWFRGLWTRANVACVLGRPAPEVKSAVELAYKLAMKFDFGSSIVGRLLTRAFRVGALETGLSIAESQSDRSTLLRSLRSVAPTRVFSPRDAWLGGCAYQVETLRQWLKKTDAELDKEAKSIPSVTDKTTLALLQWAKSDLEMNCGMLAHIPSSIQLGKPQDAKQVIDGYEAVSKDKPQSERDPVCSGVRSLIEHDLRESMSLVVVDLRIEESRAGSLPDAAGQKRLLAAFDGLKIRQTDDGVEVTLSDDHPVLTLSADKERIPRQRVKRWSKK